MCALGCFVSGMGSFPKDTPQQIIDYRFFKPFNPDNWWVCLGRSNDYFLEEQSLSLYFKHFLGFSFTDNAGSKNICYIGHNNWLKRVSTKQH